MSAVKIKNAIARRLGALMQEGKLPGLRSFEVKLDQARIRVRVLSTEFDCYAPGVIELSQYGHTVRCTLFAKPGDHGYAYTAEADQLEAAIKAVAADTIAAAGATGGCSIYFDTDREQAQRMRESAKGAATVAA
jgi:hypothetical protein